MNKISFTRTPDVAVENIKGYFGVGLFLALISAALRTLAYFFSFDLEIGYFNGGFLASLATYFIIASCAFIFSGIFFISKEAAFPKKLNNDGNAIYFASLFAGFIMIADFAYKIYFMIGEDKFGYYKVIFSRAYRSDNAYVTRATAIIELLGVLAAAIASVCFFIRSSKKFDSKLCAWLGFFPIIRALSGVAQVYFEMGIQMNHPSKLMLEFAFVSIMLALLYELRFFIAEDQAKPVQFFVFSMVAVIVSLTAGVSEIVGFFAGRLSNGDFCIEAFFCLTMSLYIASRMISYVKSLGNNKSEEEIVE